MNVRENISSKLIKHSFDNIFEEFFIEINLRRKKWYLRCSYNSNKNDIFIHSQIISNTLDSLSQSYDDFILVGDFNVEPLLCQIS